MGFFHETALERHNLSKHDKNCLSCSLIFVGQKDLVEHLKEVHGFEDDDENLLLLFRCTLCNKGFRSQKNCLKHNSLSHRLSCEECPLKFVQRTELSKHWQELH